MLTEHAYAKVNLYLHITGKRADGYHLLKSLVVFCEQGDKISVTASDTLHLRMEGAFAHYLDTQNNLVMKAAQALQAAFAVEQGAAIILNKNLPVAAGIGGGSADAAATLRVLVRLWKLTPSAQQLHDIALSLGADVPVCLRHTPAFMEGAGESVTPVASAIPALYILLVNPGEALATAEVFREFSGPFVDMPHIALPCAAVEKFIAGLRGCYNALQSPAGHLQPLIPAMLTLLDEQAGCLLSRMSGSGATCFGLFAQEEEAAQAARRIQATKPRWWVQYAKVLT